MFLIINFYRFDRKIIGHNCFVFFLQCCIFADILIDQHQFMDNETNFQNQTIALNGSNLILILGILSILTIFIYGLGLVFGIVGLKKATEWKIVYDINPDAYRKSSLQKREIGRLCSLIGICLSGFNILGLLIYIFFLGGMPF